MTTKPLKKALQQFQIFAIDSIRGQLENSKFMGFIIKSSRNVQLVGFEYVTVVDGVYSLMSPEIDMQGKLKSHT
jgi:hypothetical protein